MTETAEEIQEWEFKDLFKDVRFFITGDVDEKIVDLLKGGGAERHNYFSDYVTHLIVGNNPEENDIVDANDVYEIPALQPKWVLMCSSLKKLVSTKSYLYSPRAKLFSNLTFCFSNVREDLTYLWSLVTYNGGIVQLNFNKNCNFLVTTDTSSVKYDKAESLDLNVIKIVTPDWLVETAKNGSFSDVALFHPRLINWPKPVKIESTTAAITGFEADQAEPEEPKEEKTISDSTQALLEKLKQRMPWNQPNTSQISTSSETRAPPNVVAPSFIQKTAVQQIPQTSRPQVPVTPQSPSSSNFPQIPKSPTTSLPNQQIQRSIVHHTSQQQNFQHQNQQQVQQQPSLQQNHPLNIGRLLGQQQPRPNLALRGQLGQNQIHQQLLQQRIQQQQSQQQIIQRASITQQLQQQQQQQQILQQQLSQRQLLQNQINQGQLSQNQQNQQLLGPNQQLEQLNQHIQKQNHTQLHVNQKIPNQQLIQNQLNQQSPRPINQQNIQQQIHLSQENFVQQNVNQHIMTQQNQQILQKQSFLNQQQQVVTSSQVIQNQPNLAIQQQQPFITQELNQQSSTQQTNVNQQINEQVLNQQNQLHQQLSQQKHLGQQIGHQDAIIQQLNQLGHPQNQLSQISQQNQLGQQLNQQNRLGQQLNQQNQLGQQMNQQQLQLGQQLNQQNQLGQLNQQSQLGQQINQQNQLGQLNQQNQLGQLNQQNQLGQLNQQNQLGQLNQQNQLGQQLNQQNQLGQQINQQNQLGQQLNQQNQLGQQLTQQNQLGQQLNQQNHLGQQLNQQSQLGSLSQQTQLGQINPQNPIGQQHNQQNQLGQQQILQQSQISQPNPNQLNLQQNNQNQLNQNQMTQQQISQNQLNQPVNNQNTLNQLQLNHLGQQLDQHNQLNQQNLLNQQNQINQQSQLNQQNQLNQQTLEGLGQQALSQHTLQQQLNRQNLQLLQQPNLNQQVVQQQNLQQQSPVQQTMQQGLNQQRLQEINQQQGISQNLQQQVMNQQSLQQGLNQQTLQQQHNLNQQNLQQQQMNQVNQQVNTGLQQQVVRTQYQQQQQPGLGQQILLNQTSPQNQPQRAQINQHLWAQQPGQMPGQQIIRHPVNIVQQGVPRMQWSPNQGNAVPQRQFIQLDAKTHNELQKMPPEQQALFVARLQRQRQLIKHVQQRGTGGSHILIRGSVPPGLTTQQQVQWLQQQAKQHGIVLPPNIQQQNITPGTLTQPVPAQNFQHGAPGLSPINQNAPPQQQQFTEQNQQQLQLRQYRLQQLQLQREQAQKTHLTQQGAIQQPAIVRPIGQTQLADSTTNPPHVPDSGNIQHSLVVNAKTKTALANMLSIKLQSGGGSSMGVQRPDSIQEPSAAGTLRLMTAQHNAALNSKPQEIIALQRRTINGPNGEIIKPPGAQSLPVTPTNEPPKLYCPKPTQPMQHRPGPFYGHNPNLKLPPDLFLLGCIFVVVEIESFLDKELPGWQQKIEKYGGEVEKQYCSRVTHVLCETQRHGVVMTALRDLKRCVTIVWLCDVMHKRQVLPPWTALHLPNIYLDTAPASKHLISIMGFEGIERDRVKQMIKYTGAKCTTYFSKHNTLLIASKQEGKKCTYAKKWQIPVVNVQWLTDIMLGHFSALNQTEHHSYQQFPNPPNFCFDPKLVPTLMSAWKAPINISQESYERVKRSTSPVVLPKKPKKQKTEPTDENDNISDDQMGNATHRILFSMYLNTKELEDMVRDLGGRVSKSHDDFTHLVMPQLARSNKLFFAIATCAYVVSDQWLRDSHKAKRFLNETNYNLNAKEFNFTYKCDIERTFQTRNRNRLFEGKFFFVTPSVFPSKKVVVSLIQASGGTVERIRRSGAQIEATNINSPYSYFIITHEDDLHLVGDLLKNKKDKLRIVCNVELIYSAVLNQTFEVEPYAVCVL